MSDISSLKAFFKGSAVLILSNMFIKAIQFFLLPLYTKNLTPQMLGISDTVTSFAGLLLPLLTMGLDSAYSAFYFDKKDEGRADKVFYTSSFLLMLAGGVPFLLCFFLKQFSYMLFGREDYVLVLFLSLLSVSFNLFYLPYALEIRLQNKMAVYGVITVISSFSMVVCNILFVSVVKMGACALALSTAIVNILQLILFSVCAHKKFAIGYVDSGLMKKMLSFSLPLVPSIVAMWVLNLSDRYVILYFLGEEAVGLYGIGTRFVTLINMVISAVSMAYTTFAYANADHPDAEKQYTAVLNLMYVMLIGAAFVISVFSKEVIQIMTSEGYLQAYEPVRDMMFAQVIYGISTITSYGIYFKKKSKYVLLSASSAALVNLILNVIFIPKFGISAAAAATLAGYLVMFLINYVYSQKCYPCDYGIKRIICNMGILYAAAYIFCGSCFTVRIISMLFCALLTFVMFAGKLKKIFSILKTGVIGREQKKRS